MTIRELDGPGVGTEERGRRVAEIAATIRRHIVDTFLLGADDGFSDESSLVESGIVDSTGIMETVDFVEDTFGIAVRDVDLVSENFDSVACMARFVADRIDALP